MYKKYDPDKWPFNPSNANDLGRMEDNLEILKDAPEGTYQSAREAVLGQAAIIGKYIDAVLGEGTCEEAISDTSDLAEYEHFLSSFFAYVSASAEERKKPFAERYGLKLIKSGK